MGATTTTTLRKRPRKSPPKKLLKTLPKLRRQWRMELLQRGAKKEPRNLLRLKRWLVRAAGAPRGPPARTNDDVFKNSDMTCKYTGDSIAQINYPNSLKIVIRLNLMHQICFMKSIGPLLVELTGCYQHACISFLARSLLI